MTTVQTPSRDKNWTRASVCLTAVLVLLAAIVGLILLPSLQRNVSYSSLWDAICSAAGVPRLWHQVGSIVPPSEKLTQV